MLSENNEEVIPVIVRDNLKSSFDVVFSWSEGAKGAFKSEDIVYQNYSNVVDWKREAYKFWQNTQFVIYKTFKYEASFITMVYGELLHNCVLHIEARKGESESILVDKLKDGSEEGSFRIQIVVKDVDLFDDLSLFGTPPSSGAEDRVTLFDLVSFGYKMAKDSALELDERIIKTIKRLSSLLARELITLLNIDKAKVNVIEEISLMLVSYGYPSRTFSEKYFSLYNQKGYSEGEKNYSSSGKFVIWKRPIIGVMAGNLEYKLWVKTLKLEAYSRTIKNLLDLSRYQAIRSAIGSIMSRNGSHNIGSHVLAALSHNVGTMPDDQVLYQYIQHRMDYIATATTERPSWSQPTMFVGDMMRRFLSQRHLLNYISRSEGLKAWEFQSDRANIEEEGGRIKFHIRKVDKQGRKLYDFIQYDNEVKDQCELSDNYGGNSSEDVSLAIPGGVVGQHAFFTIIENIVRNAAKHDWSTPPKRTAVLKEVKFGAGDLDIYIDFEVDPEDENVHFKIWTRLSDVFEKVAKTEQNVREATNKELDDWKCLSDLSKLPVHHHQHVELAKSLIDDTGELRRENWGLAEMKISAGYLQKAKIEDVGGIGNSGYNIIKPCSVPDGLADEEIFPLETSAEDAKAVCSELNAVYHLGYKFDVPKSKFVLFVIEKKPKGLSEEIELALRHQGIYIKLGGAIAEGSALNYEYVVLNSFKKANSNWVLPSRVIAVCDNGDKEWSPKIPLLKHKECNSVDAVLNAILEDSNNDGDKIACTLKEIVCACWARHLREQRNLAKPISMLLEVSTSSSNKKDAGKSLISEMDIVEFAFNEGFLSSINVYEKAGKQRCKNKSLAEIALSVVSENQNLLSALRDLSRRRLLFFRRARELNKGQLRALVSRKAIIRHQLSLLLKDCSDNDELAKVFKYLTLRHTLEAAIESAKLTLAEKGDRIASDKKEELSKSKYKLESSLTRLITLWHPVEHFVDFLDAYCEQIKGILSKYSENVATLPHGFSVRDSHAGDKIESKWDNGGVYLIKDKDVEKLSKPYIRYKRHHSLRAEDEYLESLSGTQSYLNTLERIQYNDWTMITRLLENALLRILIIDERTRDFLAKHPGLSTYFNNMQICVADDKKVDDELSILESAEDARKRISELKIQGVNDNERIKEGEDKVKAADQIIASCSDEKQIDFNAEGLVCLSTKRIYEARKGFNTEDDRNNEIIEQARNRFYNRFEILIIHQGIIDKWLPGASHDKKKVGEFLKSLQKIFRYVVITTGRGMPANIPDFGRVLPFSTIQTTLFRQYPEKLILTDAVMNLLPVKGSDNGK